MPTLVSKLSVRATNLPCRSAIGEHRRVYPSERFGRCSHRAGDRCLAPTNLLQCLGVRFSQPRGRREGLAQVEYFLRTPRIDQHDGAPGGIGLHDPLQPCIELAHVALGEPEREMQPVGMHSFVVSARLAKAVFCLARLPGDSCRSGASPVGNRPGGHSGKRRSPAQGFAL